MYYMFLAEGFEETEALVTLDMLRRADVDVQTVGIGNIRVKGAHGICVEADLHESDTLLDAVDGIILPGGMPGTENLYASETVMKFVDYCFANKLLISAICAAPIILGRRGYLQDVKAVCFPGFEEELTGAIIENAPSVVCSDIITAKGAGCVFEFSHNIISYIRDSSCADEIISVIQHKGL